MDTLDLKILEALKENGRTTASEISKRVSLSLPATAERIRKLEEAGVIEQYTVRLRREKLGLKLLAFIFVNVDRAEHIAGFRQALLELEGVLEIHHVAGEYDYLLKVLVEDSRALEDFISRRLKGITGFLRSNTIIVLSSLKEDVNL